MGFLQRADFLAICGITRWACLLLVARPRAASQYGHFSGTRGYSAKGGWVDSWKNSGSCRTFRRCRPRSVQRPYFITANLQPLPATNRSPSSAQGQHTPNSQSPNYRPYLDCSQGTFFVMEVTPGCTQRSLLAKFGESVKCWGSNPGWLHARPPLPFAIHLSSL